MYPGRESAEVATEVAEEVGVETSEEARLRKRLGGKVPPDGVVGGLLVVIEQTNEVPQEGSNRPSKRAKD